MPENPLNSSLQFIPKVGPKRAEAFAKVGLRSIRDLLFYFPFKHLDRTKIVSSSQAYQHLLNGYDGEITVIGKVYDTSVKNFKGRGILTVVFNDPGGFFDCVWFQGIKFFQDRFKAGQTYAISAKPSISKYGQLQFIHPDFDYLTNEESTGFYNTGKIIPFYKIPGELKLKNIGDLSLRKMIDFAISKYSGYIEETIPVYLLEKYNLPALKESIRSLHFPDSQEELNRSWQRLKYEELLYLEILVALRKEKNNSVIKTRSLKVKTSLVADFLKTLPFELTQSQLNALKEIRQDLALERPMNRLLQGDVGSGKTIVAVIAMLIAADNGYQSVLMAPTEILADQHAKNISGYLSRLAEKFPQHQLKLTLLLGGRSKSVKEKTREKNELKEANIIIGTHALFEENVEFENVGLVVIDEQHRFGVAQRGKLLSKGANPDVLIMSATPIPRTLSMTVYGDLDTSVISEMPKDRLPVKTYLRGESSLPKIYQFVKDKLQEGYQSFIVYPLVEESEKVELKAAETYYSELSEGYLKDLNVGLIHGKMKWQQKEEIMLLFAAKKYDVLISTTVIEVGIDIPDANIIIINDAHQFGLAQLHQLRGRVGRGKVQAHCILVTKDELAASVTRFSRNTEYMTSAQLEKFKTAVRLNTMVTNNDGFKVAEVDLKLRGPGDIFGIKQSGYPELKYADITVDEELISSAREDAFSIIRKDIHLRTPENSVLRKNLLTHFSDVLRFSTVG
ncbi:MAG: ATP-dependent DNA helicase RecG [Ignavibacteriaceae bacterium]|nr:ATP-dependent DNA helicase RecG [Ignavibacteriaceae bacterium]